MSGTRVLVTGGAGFIGSHVAEHFARTGHDVVIFDNLSRHRLLGKPSLNQFNNWEYLRENCPSVELIEGDVRSADQLKKAASGAALVVHTGAQVAVTTSLKDPRTDFEVNALGTVNVLEEARRNDSAVIFCSTNKVYGENVNSIPLRELSKRYEYADPIYTDGVPESLPVDHTCHTPYGCSKLAGDIYAQDYALTYGIRTGVFRLSCIYGVRQSGVEDQGWLAWFARAAIQGTPITIYGNGKQVRDALWVDDLVAAFDSFYRNSSGHGVFNVGGGPQNTVSLLELRQLLGEMTGNDLEVTFLDWRKADQRVYISNVTKVHERLNWIPTTSVSTGLSKLIVWMRMVLGEEKRFSEPVVATQYES